MGLSFIAEALLRSHLPDAPWRALVCKIGYTFGFMAVILGKQQLFTENTVTAVLPALNKRDWATFNKVMKLWVLVLLSNLAGAHMLAWVLTTSSAFRPEIHQVFAEIGREAADVTFWSAVIRGVFAGWIIALMVWILAGTAQNSRLWVILMLTYLVGLAGLSHVIAGSIEVVYLVASGEKSWFSYAQGYLVPALLGNSIGGVALVSALNHAQVVSDRQHNPRIKAKS